MSPPSQEWLQDEIRAINAKLDTIARDVSGMGSRLAVVETKVADARGGLKWFGGVIIALLSSAATWLLGTKAP
jgi:hypothetical protein